MSANTKAKLQDVDFKQIEEILERAQLSDEDRELLERVVQSYAYLTQLVGDKNTSIQRLRKLLFGSKSEKTRKVLGTEEEDAGEGPPATAAAAAQEETAGPRKRRKGHGRHGARAYRGAEKITVAHPSLSAGERCPQCRKGKVYVLPEPGVIVRVRGQAPLRATVYELEKLRCNLCGKVFTARAPEGIGEKKYDATSASMIALLRYGSGLPFNRVQRLERSLGIPLPASTQWEIVEACARQIEPVFAELIRQAAQGEVVHNDDTSMKVLQLMQERKKAETGASEKKTRTGIFTSGIVSRLKDRRMALFFTGHQHAGENLAEVLARRAAALSAPIQMCDALSRNTSGGHKSIVANCLAHGRRGFVEVAENFPAECKHVLETLGEVYRNDAQAAEQSLSPHKRLDHHRATSRRPMVELRIWMRGLIREKKVEPNSSLGEALRYMLKHWKKLTLFYRVAGAPLDNNLCERALKKAIMHRKNSLFYKTENGARVGDLFMSLIHTAELCGANPFDYLTALQRHADELRESPARWMPWNYLQRPAPVHVAANS